MAIVASPNRQFLWLLTRDKAEPSSSELNQFYSMALQSGYTQNQLDQLIKSTKTC